MLKSYVKLMLETLDRDDRVVLWDFMQENFMTLGFKTIFENNEHIVLEKEQGIKRVFVDFYSNFSWREHRENFPTISVIDAKFYEFDERLMKMSEGWVNVDHKRIELGDTDGGYVVHSVEFRGDDERPIPNRRAFNRSEWKNIANREFFDKIGLPEDLITDYGLLDSDYMNFPLGAPIFVHPTGRNYLEYIFVQEQPNLETSMQKIIDLRNQIERFLNEQH